MPDPCAQQLKAVLGDIITSDLSESIVKRLRGMAKAEVAKLGIKKGDAGFDAEMDKALQAVTAKMVNEVQASSLNEIRRAYKDAVALTGAWKHVTSGKPEDVGRKLAELMGAVTWKSEYGSASGADNIKKALRNMWHGKLFGRLAAENLSKDLKSGDMDMDIGFELLQLSMGKNGKPGGSNNPRAARIAAVVKDTLEEMRAAKNSEGAHVASLEDFIVSQMHNDVKMRKSGFEAWAAFILPRLDADRTFNGMEPEVWLKEAYKSFSAGVWGREQSGDAGTLTGEDVTGSAMASIAQRVSASRKIHFKDHRGFVEYNREFGAGKLENVIAAMIRDSARAVALMHTFGPNADRNVSILRRKAQSYLRENLEGVKADTVLDPALLDDAWHNLTGGADRPQNMAWATFFNGWRSLKRLTTLGGSGITAMTDRATIQSMARMNGFTYMESMFKQLELVAPRSAALKEFLREELVGVEAAMGHIARFHEDNWQPDTLLNKANTVLFRANLLQYITENGRFVAAEMLGWNLNRNLGKAFGDLDANLQLSLRRHKIDALEWDVIRSVGEGITVPDRTDKYVIPRQMLRLGDDQVSRLLEAEGLGVNPKAIERMKNELYLRLGTYFADEIDTGIPERGLAQDVYIKGGGVSGKVLSEFRRNFWQLKAFPLAVWQKHHLREVHRHGHSTLWENVTRSHGLPLVHVAALTAQAAVLGYAAMSIKALLAGKTRPPLANEDGEVYYSTIARALASGGGAGIMGDVLFGEFDTRKRDFLESALGPTATDINSAASLFSKGSRYMAGEPDAEPPAGEIRKLLQGNIPFSNVFYLRYALNRLVFWHIEEMVSPGRMERMERDMERTGERYWLPGPAEVVE